MHSAPEEPSLFARAAEVAARACAHAALFGPGCVRVSPTALERGRPRERRRAREPRRKPRRRPRARRARPDDPVRALVRHDARRARGRSRGCSGSDGARQVIEFLHDRCRKVAFAEAHGGRDPCEQREPASGAASASVRGGACAHRLRRPHQPGHRARHRRLHRLGDARAAAPLGHARPRAADYPWYHPTGWVRKDAYDPTSDDPSLHTIDLDKVRAQVLDPHDVTFGIATPDDMAAASRPAEPADRGQARERVQRLAARALARAGAAPARADRVSPQNPQAAANEIRRVGGRDEFVGVFLPGGARIPYGNPVHDPIWEAANELGLPVVVHTHYEGVGIAGPVTAAGYPDFYVEYHTLCGSRHVRALRLDPLPRDLRALPGHEGDDGRGRARPVRRAALAPRHELEGLPQRDPVVPQPPVRVRLGSRPVRDPAARDARRSRRCSPRRSRACARGTRSASRATTRTGTTTSPRRRCARCRRSGARTSPGATPRSSSACPFRRSSSDGDDDRARGPPAAGRGARRGRAPAASSSAAARSASSARRRRSSRSPTAARTAARRSARAARSRTPSRAWATRRASRARARSCAARGTSGTSTSRPGAAPSTHGCACAATRVRVEGDDLVVSLDAAPAAR